MGRAKKKKKRMSQGSQSSPIAVDDTLYLCNVIAGTERIVNGVECVKVEWVGETGPKSTQYIPLSEIEDVNDTLPDCYITLSPFPQLGDDNQPLYYTFDPPIDQYMKDEEEGEEAEPGVISNDRSFEELMEEDEDEDEYFYEKNIQFASTSFARKILESSNKNKTVEKPVADHEPANESQSEAAEEEEAAVLNSDGDSDEDLFSEEVEQPEYSTQEETVKGDDRDHGDDGDGDGDAQVEDDWDNEFETSQEWQTQDDAQVPSSQDKSDHDALRKINHIGKSLKLKSQTIDVATTVWKNIKTTHNVKQYHYADLAAGVWMMIITLVNSNSQQIYINPLKDTIDQRKIASLAKCDYDEAKAISDQLLTNAIVLLPGWFINLYCQRI